MKHVRAIPYRQLKPILTLTGRNFIGKNCGLLLSKTFFTYVEQDFLHVCKSYEFFSLVGAGAAASTGARLIYAGSSLP